jgi:hypothetical protein
VTGSGCWAETAGTAVNTTDAPKVPRKLRRLIIALGFILNSDDLGMEEHSTLRSDALRFFREGQLFTPIVSQATGEMLG